MAVGAELVNPGIAVSVRDEQVPVGRQGHVGGGVEGRARTQDGLVVGAVVAGVGHAVGGRQGHQQLSLRRELVHPVPVVIHAENDVIGADEDHVRPHEDPFPPGAQIAAIPVKDDHRILGAAESVDPVL